MWSDYVEVPQPTHSLGHSGCFTHSECRIKKEGHVKGLDKKDLVGDDKVIPEALSRQHFVSAAFLSMLNTSRAKRAHR